MQITPMISCIQRKPFDGICDDGPPGIGDGASALMALSLCAPLLGTHRSWRVMALHHTILVYYIPNRKVEIDARPGCVRLRPSVVDRPILVVKASATAPLESTPEKRKWPRISGPFRNDHIRL